MKNVGLHDDQFFVSEDFSSDKSVFEDQQPPSWYLIFLYTFFIFCREYKMQEFVVTEVKEEDEVTVNMEQLEHIRTSLFTKQKKKKKKSSYKEVEKRPQCNKIL